jgi:hypothetical protein
MSAELSGEPEATRTALDEKLQAFVGMSGGEPNRAPDPVNLPMIRHWVEAMGDFNPVYVDEKAARQFGFPGIVAPPTMLQAWIMRGLRISLDVEAARAEGRSPRSDSPTDNLMSLLDEAGFTSVVATNCDQHYERPIVLGDDLSVTSTIAAVSSEKKRHSDPVTSFPPSSTITTSTVTWSPPCSSGSSSSSPGPRRRHQGRHRRRPPSRLVRGDPDLRSPRTTASSSTAPARASS